MKTTPKSKKDLAKNIAFTALCVALCLLLPYVFHTIPMGGIIFLPMFFPVLLCAMSCGIRYAVICAVTGPILSSLVTGMPSFAMLPAMLVECLVYAIVAPLLLKIVKTKHVFADLYISLIIAILLGRCSSALMNMALYSGSFSLTAWLQTTLLKGLAGVAIQLAILPSLVVLLIKIKLLPPRYPKPDKQ